MRRILSTILFCTLVFNNLPHTDAANVTSPAQTACFETGGQVEQVAYHSELLQMDMVYSVYLPPCYRFSGQKYPVVYLMHGSNTDDGQWLRLGLAQTLDQAITDGTLPPMIVVLPFGNWIANENRFDDSSWANVFLHELLPDAESRYRIDARRASRAIGGISRGGFWAFHIALLHPEMFSAVGGHSAFFDEYNAPPGQNPLDLVLTAQGVEELHIWLDRGKDDYAQLNIDLMDRRLTERGLPHQYVIYPLGEHDDSYWSQHVLEYLRFYAADWTFPQTADEKALYLLVPAISFPSLRDSITRVDLRRVANGELDPTLIMSTTTVQVLEQLGVVLHRDTRVVPPDALEEALWADREAYTLLPFDQLTPRYRMLNVDGQVPLDGILSSYPFAFQSDTPNYDPAQLTRIQLSGTTALGRNTLAALDANGIVWAGGGILPYVSHADFFHTSNEVSFAPRCPESDKPVLGGLCAKDAHFMLLTYLGVDIVELTGNHNNDYGYDVYTRTLDMYHNAGIATLGGGRTLAEARAPYIIQHHGNRIAMLACNWNGPDYALVDEENNDSWGIRPGAAYCDRSWLSAAIPQLAAENDLVVVTVQYAEYDLYTPIDRQVTDFHWLADLGADVVIGTQAHKPQTFEFYSPAAGEPAFIHYGMGNLFFDQPEWEHVRFFMDQLFVYEGRLLTVDLFTGIIEDKGRPRPMTPDERLEFLDLMFNDMN